MYAFPKGGVLSLRSHIWAICHDCHRKNRRQYLRYHQPFTTVLGIMALFPVFDFSEIHPLRMVTYRPRGREENADAGFLPRLESMTPANS